MDGGDALTLKQVAGRLSVSEKTVRRLVREGRFPAPFLVGKAHRWWARDADSYLWLASRLPAGQAPAEQPSDADDEEG